jgi:putative drug exporter of the RND superfamily
MVRGVSGKAQGNSRRRFRLAMIGFAIVLGLAPFSYRVEDRLETAFHIRGGEAEEVEKELNNRFQSPYGDRVILVIEGLPESASTGRSEAIKFVSNSLRTEPGVSGVLSELDWPDELFHGKDGGTLVIVGLKPQAGSTETLLPKLRERAEWIQDRLRVPFPGAKLELTGQTALNVDLRKVSSVDANRAELRALPVTLVLLLLAFGSVVAAMLPLSLGVLAISMTMGAASLLASRFHLSILVQNMATMLGLGLGIDYALLMVSRFREAMADGNDPGTAADIAGRQVGHTLVISASTVAIGFAALLWVPISELSSIGVAGLLVAAMSVLLCTLILPYVLGLLGTRINAGTVGILSRSQRARQNASRQAELWRRWGMVVTAFPWTALVLAGAPLLLLAFQARRTFVGLPTGDWLPSSAKSVQALHSLEYMGRAGIVQPLRIIVEPPAGSSINSPQVWNALTRLTQYLKNDPRSAEVISLPGLLGASGAAGSINFLPESTRKSFLRNDGRATLIEVLPAPEVTPSEQIRWVRQLRNVDLKSITGLPRFVVRIGGIPALNADYDRIVHERLLPVMEAVIGGSFLALLLGFRSVFVALKAVFLNLLSVGASFGALVLVFQDGHGSWIFGLTGGVGSIFPIVPILSFAIVFGLSMDYEVFLVARVLEERRRGLPERDAVVEGLASTAGLITSAAVIMIAVFAAFTMGNFLIVKMLGFTLAAAVLIDATVVRMVIGPALLQLGGDWNWWPLGLAASPAVLKEELHR